MPSLSSALANILHLLDLPEQPRLGQIGLTGTELASALAPVGVRVPDLRPEASPLAPGTLDLVLLWGAMDTHALSALRPGGWLVLIREFAGRRKPVHPVARGRVVEVRRWLVSPGLHFPYAIVPFTRVAMRSHELATREAGWKRTVRLAGIALGLPAREFTGEVVAVRVR